MHKRKKYFLVDTLPPYTHVKFKKKEFSKKNLVHPSTKKTVAMVTVGK